MSTNQNQNLYFSDCYTFICSFNVWYRKIYKLNDTIFKNDEYIE